MDQTKQPDLFEFNSFVFRVNPAPFDAQFISQEHTLELKDDYPLAADTVFNSTYMDNRMDSETDKNCSIKLHQELSVLWEKTNMHARKWLSNSAKVFEKIPTVDRVNEVDLSKEYILSVKTLKLL